MRTIKSNNKLAYTARRGFSSPLSLSLLFSLAELIKRVGEIKWNIISRRYDNILSFSQACAQEIRNRNETFDLRGIQISFFIRVILAAISRKQRGNADGSASRNEMKYFFGESD